MVFGVRIVSTHGSCAMLNVSACELAGGFIQMKKTLNASFIYSIYPIYNLIHFWFSSQAIAIS